MKKILIYGAGGFGREVQWLIERINEKNPTWEIEGYLDDGIAKGKVINGYPVLGGMEELSNHENEAVVFAIGSARVRKIVVEKAKKMGTFVYPNLIDPTVQMAEYNVLGEGNIICAGNILTVNITLGDFVIVNLDCTVGHDADIKSFVTLYPSVNVSGCVSIGQVTEIGTGTNIIQGIEIGEQTIIGAGTVVIRDIPGGCTAVGNPARIIKGL